MKRIPKATYYYDCDNLYAYVVCCDRWVSRKGAFYYAGFPVGKCFIAH